MALRFSEEILLLALDDATGKLHPLPERALEFAVVGALLMELAFAHKIDTDDKELTILDRSACGDPLLEEVLTLLPSDVDTLPIHQAISLTRVKAPEFKEQLFQGLLDKGILKQEEHRFLWVLSERRYPVIDGREEDEVKSRIREVVLQDAIPDPKDVVIICLIVACDLAPYLFSAEELDKARPRLEVVAQMDFIGQALARAIQQIQNAILEGISYMGM